VRIALSNSSSLLRMTLQCSIEKLLENSEVTAVAAAAEAFARASIFFGVSGVPFVWLCPRLDQPVMDADGDDCLATKLEHLVPHVQLLGLLSQLTQPILHLLVPRMVQISELIGDLTQDVGVPAATLLALWARIPIEASVHLAA
jgi:hypothetical protein